MAESRVRLLEREEAVPKGLPILDVRLPRRPRMLFVLVPSFAGVDGGAPGFLKPSLSATLASDVACCPTVGGRLADRPPCCCCRPCGVAFAGLFWMVVRGSEERVVLATDWDTRDVVVSPPSPPLGLKSERSSEVIEGTEESVFERWCMPLEEFV